MISYSKLGRLVMIGELATNNTERHGSIKLYRFDYLAKKNCNILKKQTNKKRLNIFKTLCTGLKKL